MSTTPYQVALVSHGEDAHVGQFCGGAILDETHVVTAAHCVFDNSHTLPGQPISPDALDVVMGSRRLFGTKGDASGFRSPVSEVSFAPQFNPGTFGRDVALLTLAVQIGTTSTIAPIQPIDAGTWSHLTLSTPATVTGWGETDDGSYPFVLQTANVPLVADSACAPAYQGFDATVMTCAGDDDTDACFGDSGGPLVVPDFNFPDEPRLLGIVSFGPPDACAKAGYPGGYTEVHAPEIMSFMTQTDPVAAPRSAIGPSLSGTPTVGSTVTCVPGTWSGGGASSLSYQFVSPTASGNVARTSQGAQSTYVVQPGDAGSALRCDVKAANAGGFAYASSAAVTVPVPEQPPAQQPPDTGNEQPSQTQQDTVAPVARVTKTACTTTRCTLTVNVTDAGFSSGIKTVTATVRTTYHTTCRKRGRKVPCTRTKNGRTSVAALSSTRFKIVASKLPVGKQVFTLFAIDKAGHRQALPTTKTVTTKKPKKKKSSKKRR